MAKQSIGRGSGVHPMPVVIVGTVTDGRPNFMTVAWMMRVEYDPPLVAISLGQKQHTAKGIQQTGQFSISYPSIDQAALTDYCGLVHGYEEDKTARVEVFKGSLESAPMVSQCPLTVECRLTKTVELPRHFLFVGEIENAYASETVLTGGKVDVVKLRPVVLTMPDNSYWALGDRVGDAWGMGKALLASSEQPGA